MSRKKTGKETGRMRSSNVVYSRPNTPYVSVYCSGSPSGTHAKAPIASFYPEVHADAIVWLAVLGSYYDPSLPHAVPVAKDVSQWLDGDTWVRKEGHDPGIFYSEGFRVRWDLECPQCGLRRVIATPSSLYEPFTAIAQLRLPEIELMHLVHSQRRAEEQ